MCFFLNFACAISWTLKIRIELSVFLLFCLLWITKVYPWQDSASLSERKSLWSTFVRIGERLISRCCQPSSSSVFSKRGLGLGGDFLFKTAIGGLLERKRRTWRTNLNWWIDCVLHMNVFIVWSYVVLALNDCHRILTRRVNPHSIWRECAISLASEFQRGHSRKKHDQLSSWSYNCCVVVSGRFKRCLHWTFQLGNYSLGESSSP